MIMGGSPFEVGCALSELALCKGFEAKQKVAGVHELLRIARVH